MDVEPTLAYVSQTGTNASSKSRDPTVLQEQCNLNKTKSILKKIRKTKREAKREGESRHEN